MDHRYDCSVFCEGALWVREYSGIHFNPGIWSEQCEYFASGFSTWLSTEHHCGMDVSKKDRSKGLDSFGITCPGWSCPWGITFEECECSND